MKKLAFLGGAAGLGLLALLYSPTTHASDHLDGSTSAMNPMADIADVFAWNTTDATLVNLAMTVSPFEGVIAGDHSFGPDVLYAFHVTSRPGFGMAGVETKVICKFADDTHGECWVVNPMGTVIDYVNGDLSGPVGRISRSGKFRVFAGKRSDPFFFNFGGFVSAETYARTQCGGSCPGGTITSDAAGCLKPTVAQAGTIRTLVVSPPAQTIGPCQMGVKDCFAAANVMAIVVQVDKTELLNGTDKLVSVWASTHAAQ